MSSQKALVAVLQQEITFYNNEITAVKVEDGTIYVPVKPICDFLDLAWNGQYERIQRSPVLSEMVRGIRITRTPARGGSQEMVCLPLQFLHGWLFGMQPDRIKNEAKRENIIRFQRECYQVLNDHFAAKARAQNLPALVDGPAAAALQLAEAVTHLARNQLVMETRIDSAETTLTDYGSRIAAIESELNPADRNITDQQAAQISEGVKLIASLLSDRTGRNEYGGVYMELYRRFGITSYKLLPSGKFNEAMSFLRQWYERLDENEQVPF